MNLIDLNVVEYQTALEIQKSYFEKALDLKKQSLQVENHLIFCEHPPVYTLGKSGKESNLLLSKELLGAPLINIQRGGDITFHGPGQLVVYPIIDLQAFQIGVKDFVYKIEQVIINVCSLYGLNAQRDSKNAGVWLQVGKSSQRKIAALGFKLSRHVSMHGLAFNINTDLNWFSKMIPCGLQGLGVTSLEKELGTSQDFNLVKKQMFQSFLKEFGLLSNLEKG